MNRLFFELIRVSLGTQKGLSRVPTEREWGVLYGMAMKQSIVGICCAGVKKLCDIDSRYFCGMSQDQYMAWMGTSAQFQMLNAQVDEQTERALAHFRGLGYPCVVLKGQGIATLYGPLRSLRSSGDVDLWLRIGRGELNALSMRELGRIEGLTYHHIHYPMFEDCEVEAHIWPSFLSSPLRNACWKRFCRANMPGGVAAGAGSATSALTAGDTPSLAFNRVFILLHCYRHFCGHGIGMKQLLDYYFVLVQGFTPAEKEESLRQIRRLGMLKFCRATMWLMQFVFGMDERYLLCEPDPDNGRFLLRSVLKSGNLGHGDKENRISRSALKRYWYNIRRDIRTIRICPFESLWDPFFNVYQFVMCKTLWRRTR